MYRMSQEEDIKTCFAEAAKPGPSFAPTRFLVACKNDIKSPKEMFESGFHHYLELLVADRDLYLRTNPQNQHYADLVRWLLSTLESLQSKNIAEQSAETYAAMVCISFFFDTSLFWRNVRLQPETIKFLTHGMVLSLKAVKVRLQTDTDEKLPINEQETLDEYEQAKSNNDFVRMSSLIPRFRLALDNLEHAPMQLVLNHAKYFLISHNIHEFKSYLDTVEGGLYLCVFLSNISIADRIKLCSITDNKDFIIYALFSDRASRVTVGQTTEEMSCLVTCFDKLMVDDHYAEQVARQITLVGSNPEDTVYAYGAYLANSEEKHWRVFLDNLNIEINNFDTKIYSSRSMTLIAIAYSNTKLVTFQDPFLSALYIKWDSALKNYLSEDELPLQGICHTNVDDFLCMYYYLNPIVANQHIEAALGGTKAIEKEWYKSEGQFYSTAYIQLHRYLLCHSANVARKEKIAPFGLSVEKFLDEMPLEIKEFCTLFSLV